jgi:putative membrane protein
MCFGPVLDTPVLTEEMTMTGKLVLAMAFALAITGASAKEEKLNDAQIAHIAYTAGQIDINAAKLALSKSHDPMTTAFANEMVRDHTAVNDKALALVKKLGVTPEDNPVSKSLTEAADKKKAELDKLNGAAFDKAYIENEVAYHKTVNGALSKTLIPDAKNPELKQLLETGLKLFEEHQHHAEELAAHEH